MSHKDKPIRVAQIIGKWVGGGVEAVVMNYYRHIDRSKIQFDFICDSDSTNIPYDEINSLGGKVILVPPYQHFIKFYKELKKVLKKENYQIVHSHINTLSVISLQAAKKTGVPVRVAHSHSTSNKKEWKKDLLKRLLKPYSRVAATNYMCCSEVSGRYLFGNKEYDKGSVFLLNNAIELEKFRYNETVRNDKRKELGLNDNTFVVGHIGRFVAQKNHLFIIDIFKEIKKKNNNSVLVLIGQGPLMKQIKEKVKKLELEKSVIFLGQRKDANELYQIFDVFVLPSLYEGLPVVGVEAQASGNLCYISSNTTRETKILKSTTFMSLKDNPIVWAERILRDSSNYIKHDTIDELANQGFDINKEAVKLENEYYKYLIMNKSSEVVLNKTNKDYSIDNG